MVEVTQHAIADRQLTRFEALTIRPSQNRQQDFALRPVDVEVIREGGGFPFCKDVPPPRILQAGRHVIRNNVEEKSQLMVVKVFDELFELRRASNLRIDS